MDLLVKTTNLVYTAGLLQSFYSFKPKPQKSQVPPYIISFNLFHLYIHTTTMPFKSFFFSKCDLSTVCILNSVYITQ